MDETELRSLTNLAAIKSTHLSSSPFVIILDLCAHAHLAYKWRVLFAELYQNYFSVPSAEVFGSSHEEYVTAARRKTFGFTLL